VIATALSVFVALAVGTVEYVQVLSDHLHLDGPVIGWINDLSFETLGYVIVGTFVFTWVGSVVLFKLRRVEERWGHVVAD
jgi:nickel/cobalt transporter (NiCoT) family protein